MKMEVVTRDAITIIGKSKYVKDGCGVQDVWEDANCHFDEILPLAKKHADGKLVGVWGAMSDQTMSFKPWTQNFSEGFYLAGVECMSDVVAPPGWTRWVLPAFTYLSVKIENNYAHVMGHILTEYLPQNHLRLCGAIQEFYDPAEDGQLSLYFPMDKA